MIDPVTVDFETTAIVGNPLINPPSAVGVAILSPSEPPIYLAWGHPQGNNCTRSEAGERLRQIRDSGAPLLFHNAGFDLTVWNDSFPEAKVDVDRHPVHDTMFLLFLADPYSSTLSLKPCAERYLGLPATEQTELYQWIVQHVPESTLKNAGAYISLAPGDLVGRYAIGDVVRTRQLFDKLHSRIVADGMEAAYERERRLFPILYAGTRRGIRIDRDRLQTDVQAYEGYLGLAGAHLAARLNVGIDVLDSSEGFADALERAGAVGGWNYTKTGRRSLSKDNLLIKDPEVRMLMEYRGALSTCLQTFMRPWLILSESDGRLHPNWNQVRQNYGEGRNKGTQTGRLSSDSPNFQNVPTVFKDALGRDLPAPAGFPSLPILRSYCLPEEGHVWLKRDFSSQEIRILAHFEDGGLCNAYKGDPSLDPHKMAQALVQTLTGVLYDRKEIKITGFSIIYGSGVQGLAGQLGSDMDTAGRIKSAYLAAMPDVRNLLQDVQSRGRSGGYVRTWGSRLYYAEPSKIVDGRIRDFSYKLLNYLIQGSAADQTKESLIAWEATREKEDTFLATVHDEINVSAPVDRQGPAMARLREAMNMDRFDVPMLSEGFAGPTWADIIPCE